MGPNLAGILLPKITGPADVHAADAILALRRDRARPAGRPTHAVPDPRERAARSGTRTRSPWRRPRVAYMGGAVSRFGDIAGDIGFRWTRDGHRDAVHPGEGAHRRRRAAGIRYPISGMWGGANDDLDGLQPWLTELRDIGYFGMMLGQRRPRPIVNAAFTPTADEVAYWQDLDRLATEAERDQRAGHLRRRQPGRGPRDPHRARRDRPQAARPGRGSWASSRDTRAAEIRAGLSHPIIDADGHFVEFGAAPRTRRCSPTSRRWAAARSATATRATPASPTRRPCSPGTRGAPTGAGWKAMPSWWGWATENTRDRATAHLPRCSTNGSTSSASTSRSCIRR